MSDVWPQLVLVLLLVLLNAAFAGAEMAMVSLREGQLHRLERQSANGRALAALARNPNRFLATIQIGITLAGMLASASAAVSLAAPLEESLDFLGGAADVASVVVVTIILSYFTLVFGELAPKRLAMQSAERWGLVTARPLSILSTLTRPVVWLLSKSTDIVVRILGGDPNLERGQISTQELRDLIAIQSALSSQHRAIIDGAIEITDRTLREVYLPRTVVTVLDADAGAAEGRAQLAAAGHSRAPVAPGANLDDVIGTVHLRDLIVDDDRAIRDLMSPLVVFPETVKVLDALREMQRSRVTLAVVTDEHGGAEGIITIEDIVEELVGEIYDEADRDILGVRREADGTLVVPGRFPVHDLPDLGIDLPSGPYSSVAGVVLTHLQQFPKGGESVEVGPWRFTVLAVTGLRITRVGISPVPDATE